MDKTDVEGCAFHENTALITKLAEVRNLCVLIFAKWMHECHLYCNNTH